MGLEPPNNPREFPLIGSVPCRCGFAFYDVFLSISHRTGACLADCMEFPRIHLIKGLSLKTQSFLNPIQPASCTLTIQNLHDSLYPRMCSYNVAPTNFAYASVLNDLGRSIGAP